MIAALAAVLLLAPPRAAHADPPRPSQRAAVLATGTRAIDASVLEALNTQARPVITVALPTGENVTLALEPIDPLAPGARLVTATKTANGVVESPIASDVRCWTGRVEGRSDARAFVARADGFLGGFIQLRGADGERTIWLSSGPHARNLAPVAFDPKLAAPELLPVPGEFCHADEIAQPVPLALEGAGGVAGPTPCREVLLAIETDVEFTANLFGGNQSAAVAYALALTAATSEIYTNDLNVRLRVSYVRLWTGDDPWTQSSTVNELYEYRDYWEANEAAVTRDLGHFLSGRGLGGGVAWLPGVCNGPYAYGLSANLGGGFPYPLIDNNGANWDIMVFSHELGHNFGAPHTHNYDPPLDGCGLGDCSAAATGTIMSYCHTCSGGLTNIALHFHPGNVVTMLDFLNGASCIPTGSAGGALAMDDYAVVGAGQTTTIDFLFNDERVNCESLSVQSYDLTTANGAPVTLIAAPPGGRPTFSVAEPTNAASDDSFSYTIIDSASATDSATVSLDVLPLLPATAVVGATLGATATYYEIPESSVLPNFGALTPYATDVVAQVNFASTGGNFATSGRADLVAAAFEGWVNIPTAGFWTFFSESDDGSKLFVDGQLVVANDGLHGMVEKSGVVGLQTGQHRVRVEFFENFGGAGEIVRLSGPSFSKQVIPAGLWSHGGASGADLNGDGIVNGADLAIVLGAWNAAGPLGDVNLDGIVNGADLGIVLGSWS
ncbi:MAG: M12 family metallo-peptidase [Phycisphaerae bacterium]|nr:M12 family metallo-peptidase [Phycisphaerae bacterium]